MAIVAEEVTIWTDIAKGDQGDSNSLAAMTSLVNRSTLITYLAQIIELIK